MKRLIGGGGGGGSGTPGGSDTQVQFNDGGAFGGDVDLTWNKTTNVLSIAGDVNLNDGGSFTTTLQTITPTLSNKTISLPDATGTVALVAGSSGQLVYNNAGAQAGVPGSTVGATGNVTLSLNGAASVPPFAVTGSWFAGTTPQVLIQPSNVGTTGAWSASGTGIGVNAVTGFGGNLLDLQVNGTSRFGVTPDTFTFKGHQFLSDANALVLTNSSGTRSLITRSDFSLVPSDSYFGWGNLTSFSSDLRFYRDAAGILAQRNGTAAQTFRVYNTYTSSTNYELGKLEWNSNVFRIGTEKGSGGGTARALELQTDGTTRLTVSSTGSITTATGSDFFVNSSRFLGFSGSTTLYAPSNGVLGLYNAATTSFDRLQFGGSTTSFPALKRNSAVLETKLADDSAYAQHAASVFQAATAHTVATLPATPAVGMIARVTDASAPAMGAIVAGGGAAAALVWYNGTNWRVIGV